MPIVSASHTQSSLRNQFSRFAPAIVAFPIVCFSLLLFVYAVNVPWLDDIDAFLTFILGYTDAQTIGDKIDWLLRPNNEHRILTAKLLTVGLNSLTGEVNFRWLIFLAYGFLLGILYLLYRVFRLANLPLLAFAPIPFFLLQPQHYLTSIWAITALQHQVVVLLTFGAIYLLAGKGRNRFIGATGLQVLASLSMSNGLFGWVAGAVVLILQRHWLRLSIWLMVGVATIIFYFHDFQNPQGNESSFPFFIKYPYLVFLAFFTFSGALFDFFPNAGIFWRSVLPTLAGFSLIPIALWLLWTMNKGFFRQTSTYSGTVTNAHTASVQKRRYFFTGCYAFLFVNAVTVAFLRPRFGYSVMLVSNYMLYPAVLTALIYLNLLAEQTNVRIKNRVLPIGLAASMLVWSLWYVNGWPKVAYRKQFLLTNTFNQKYNHIGFGPTWGTPFAEMASRVVNETVERGIYHYPEAYYTPYERQLLPQTAEVSSDTSLQIQLTGGDYSYLAATAPQPQQSFKGPSALLLQSKQRSYLFLSESPYFPYTFWLNRPVTTIRAEVINGFLAPGTYQVGILAPGALSKPIRFSNRQIIIPSSTGN